MTPSHDETAPAVYPAPRDGVAMALLLAGWMTSYVLIAFGFIG